MGVHYKCYFPRVKMYNLSSLPQKQNMVIITRYSSLDNLQIHFHHEML